jgi:ubiquinone/menaquinone biosynthesis C-methylase UbiE
MSKDPTSRKHDRYKASSYRAYNSYMVERYDTLIWCRLGKVDRYDRAVIDELGAQIESLSILDVGCATGRLLSSLAAAGAKRLSGVDLAPRILEAAREKLKSYPVEVELHSADVEDYLPWPSESFDVATLTGVLHHLYRPHDALREINRVLRTGGRLIVIDPCFFPPLREIVNIFVRIRPHDGDYHFYTRRGAIRLLGNEGWTEIQSRKVGSHSFFISCVKSEFPTKE